MADMRTMSELLQAPTEGYGDAIVILAILADNFELKVGLLSLVTSSQFHGFERDDPHSHIRWLNKIISTLKYKNVPHDAIKLMLIPFSLEEAARTWLEKEPPRSIHTWEDSFLKLHQIDTFYNALTQFDQDSLNAATGGNIMSRTPQDALTIIENKSKVHTSRNKPVVSKVNTTTSSLSFSQDVTALTEIVKELSESHKSSTEHPIVNEFVIINIPEEDGEPKQIILDPDDQPMWENAKILAPTPNSDIIQLDVDDNFVINSTHLNMIRENKFNGYLRADPHDHICEFLAICDMFKYGETESEAVKLLIFPISLCDEAKTCFNELNKESITSWEQMRRAFINRFFPPSLFNRLLLEIGDFSQLICESLIDAWLRLKNMLRKCHGHGLTKGAIIQIFYHGLDKPIQEILDVTAGGIFLYKSPNQAFQFLEDKILFELDWSNKSKNEHHRKFVPFADGKLNNDVKNDLEDFKSCIRSMRTVHWKLFARVNGSGSLPSNTVANLRGDVKAITTRSGIGYEGPSIPPTSSLPKEVEREPEVTKDKAVLLKKLPEKLGDPDKFLILCDFSELKECLALADLGASINLMPLFVWKKLSLPELTPTRMTLELANRSVAYPVSVAEDVFVKVGKFYFLADFVVVNYDVDPWVPLIFGRPFLRMERELIDVHGDELTFQVNDEAITFKVGHTSRYFRNYYEESVNRIDVIDVSCEEYAHEVLRFSDRSTSGGDFILEEIETFLHTSNEIYNLDDDYYDTDGDILYLEKMLNEDPSLNLPSMNADQVMLKYGVTHHLSTAYHLQMSGQVEVLNRGLKHILERTVGENQASWSDKLDDALWAFRTKFKTPIGCTPYKHVYAKACYLPIELEHKAYWALKHCNFDLKSAGDHQDSLFVSVVRNRLSIHDGSLPLSREPKVDMHTPDDDSKVTDGPDMEVSVKEAEIKNGAESRDKNE
uniref:Reverse transcriptase domain-containing protein n=1 Tax=Tanacetum cinerariifolium TaxID=118510 RepID=A0A6L2JFU0_TANCI|nr:reverse transcriptase domain-containing protein [Tanacetum cinerariifolium]